MDDFPEHHEGAHAGHGSGQAEPAAGADCGDDGGDQADGFGRVPPVCGELGKALGRAGRPEPPARRQAAAATLVQGGSRKKAPSMRGAMRQAKPMAALRPARMKPMGSRGRAQNTRPTQSMISLSRIDKNGAGRPDGGRNQRVMTRPFRAARPGARCTADTAESESRPRPSRK